MLVVWLVIAAAVLLYGLVVAAALVWLRLANLGDLLVLLLYRRSGKAPSHLSQYGGFY